METKETARIELRLEDGRALSVPGGTTIAELLKEHHIPTKSPILAAFIDNRIYRLDQAPQKSGLFRPVEHASLDGMAIYERSLVCLLLIAVRRVFPSLFLYVNHSIDGCLFCELLMRENGGRRLVRPTQKDLDRLDEFMRAKVEANIPFETAELEVAEAVKIFDELGVTDKVELLSHRKPGKIHLYKVEDFWAHFYGYLAPTTGVLRQFKLIPYQGGFLLQLPRMGDVASLPEHTDFPQLYNQYSEYEKWVTKLGVPHVAALNKAIRAGGIQDIILTVEALHEKRFSQAADDILARDELPRVLCLAGPSSSGKTTTGKRMRIQLRVNGIDCVPIGMDDYFVDRDLTPRDENGDYNFEAFEAIDSERINQDVINLIAGETVQLPKYDFKDGCQKPGEELKLSSNQVLLIEGIHGLNPKLLQGIPDALKYKIYVSPVTALNLDNTNRIRSSDLRVLRRLVRDHQFRGYSASDTLSRFPSVRAGEERHIFPFQHHADFIINTSLLYEMSVLKGIAEDLLAEIDDSSTTYSEARRLLNLLGYFEPIPTEYVPTTSILREFIGDSVFSY